MKTSLILLLVLLAAVAPCWAGTDDVLGIWYNQEKDAKIQIFKCAEKYCGKIVWLKEPNYMGDAKDGTPGTPKLDHNNPDSTLKKRPVMGLQIANDFAFAGDNLWKGGNIYDPKKGKTYSAKMTLVSPKELKLRGFIGVSLLGRTDTWTRAE
jgi:uncharacterized protein (DUF2147 family)